MSGLFINLLSGFLGILLGALVGFWLEIIKERLNRIENKILEEKLNVIPVTDEFISKAKNYPAPNVVKDESLRALAEKYLRLRVIVTGGQLKRLNEAWETLKNTTEKEMCGTSGAGVFDTSREEQKKDFEKVPKFLFQG